MATEPVRFTTWRCSRMRAPVMPIEITMTPMPMLGMADRRRMEEMVDTPPSSSSSEEPRMKATCTRPASGSALPWPKRCSASAGDERLAHRHQIDQRRRDIEGGIEQGREQAHRVGGEIGVELEPDHQHRRRRPRRSWRETHQPPGFVAGEGWRSVAQCGRVITRPLQASRVGGGAASLVREIIATSPPPTFRGRVEGAAFSLARTDLPHGYSFSVTQPCRQATPGAGCVDRRGRGGGTGGLPRIRYSSA